MRSLLKEASIWYCDEFLKTKLNDVEANVKYTIENFVRMLERQVYYAQEDVLSSPVKIEWHITNYCDQRCYFCYSGICGNKNKLNELNFDDLQKLLDSMKNENVLEVQIEGGEPLLYPHIEFVINKLKNNRHRIRLLTNGTSFTPSIIKTIKENFTKYDVLQISVHGHCSQLHDKIVGRPGSYNLLKRNLLLLEKADIPVRISVVVTNDNINYLTEIYKSIAGYKNINVFVAQPTIPVGDSSIVDLVSNEDLLCSYYSLYRVRKSYEPKLALLMGHCFDVDEIKDYIVENGKPDAIYFCSAGRSRLCIEANGDVYPCHFLKYDDFYLGNIKELSIGEIWRNSTKLKNIQYGRNEDSYCNMCEMKEHCVKKGICTSYLYNKNINDKPINCFFDDSKAKKINKLKFE